MAITFDLPTHIEQNLRRDFQDLDRVAKESALVELYRQERITRRELSEALGLGRIETDGVLKSHNVTEDLPTEREIGEDVANLRRLLDR
jgi:hypothetical protein